MGPAFLAVDEWAVIVAVLAVFHLTSDEHQFISVPSTVLGIPNSRSKIMLCGQIRGPLWSTKPFGSASDLQSNMESSRAGSRIQQLASSKCVPCKTAVPLSENEVRDRLTDLPGWAFQSESIQKEFRFKSYLSGLEFAYALGKLAEIEDHHPDMLIRWRRVQVSFSTHAINGLSINDFIMAAKTELKHRTAG